MHPPPPALTVKNQSGRKVSDGATRLCLPQQGPLRGDLSAVVLATSPDELGPADPTPGLDRPALSSQAAGRECPPSLLVARWVLCLCSGLLGESECRSVRQRCPWGPLECLGTGERWVSWVTPQQAGAAVAGGGPSACDWGCRLCFQGGSVTGPAAWCWLRKGPRVPAMGVLEGPHRLPLEPVIQEGTRRKPRCLSWPQKSHI